MLLKRQNLEQREKEILAPYAVKSAESRGRQYPEEEDPYRTCFQRDRDRIIHSKAFRRLKGKTQVFVAHYGDHYRSRLAHSMEVAQVSRDMARTLNLNEDLAEAIALAHDLGHTPFGHAGEEAMNQLLSAHGDRFEHNEQSRRVVDFLEEKRADHSGLNLSFEVRDGLLKHRTTYDRPQATDTLMPSIEAQLVNLADEIAYINHDIDDALRSGILNIGDFAILALWKEVQKRVAPGLPFEVRVMAMISELITLLVNDLTATTHGLLKKQDITDVSQVYETADALASFSPEFLTMTAELKSFLYKNFYQSKGVAAYNEKGKEVIRFLFEKFIRDPSLLPEKFRDEKTPLPIRVKDYIAGMTDNYALNLYAELSSNG